MTFEICIAIVLTALCAMLAVLAIFIGALAIWGYSGFKEVRKSIEADVTIKADAALASKLSQYPDAESLLRMFNGLREERELIEQLRNQMAVTESNNLAQASNRVQDRVEGQATESIADDYPDGQEGGANAST